MCINEKRKREMAKNYSCPGIIGYSTPLNHFSLAKCTSV